MTRLRLLADTYAPAARYASLVAIGVGSVLVMIMSASALFSGYNVVPLHREMLRFGVPPTAAAAYSRQVVQRVDREFLVVTIAAAILGAVCLQRLRRNGISNSRTASRAVGAVTGFALFPVIGGALILVASYVASLWAHL
jgi:hypothetical protein